MLLCNIFAGLRSLCSVRRRTHRTASQRALVRRTCRRTSGIYRRGLPCTPFFRCSGQTKNVAVQHFCRTSFLVLRARAHSPHCVTEVACPPHLSPYKRDLPQGTGRLSAAPVAVQAGSTAGDTPAPRFKLSGQTKNVAVQHFCRTSFLVLRAQAQSPHRVTEVACPPKFASICPAGRDDVRG